MRYQAGIPNVPSVQWETEKTQQKPTNDKIDWIERVMGKEMGDSVAGQDGDVQAFTGGKGRAAE